MPIIVYILCVYLVLHFGFVNIAKVKRKQTVTGLGVFLMCAPLTVLIIHWLGVL